eukprot:Nk52_evm45s1671 gene=Nk52_evmTU45s1671
MESLEESTFDGDEESEGEVREMPEGKEPMEFIMGGEEHTSSEFVHEIRTIELVTFVLMGSQSLLYWTLASHDPIWVELKWYGVKGLSVVFSRNAFVSVVALAWNKVVTNAIWCDTPLTTDLQFCRPLDLSSGNLLRRDAMLHAKEAVPAMTVSVAYMIWFYFTLNAIYDIMCLKSTPEQVKKGVVHKFNLWRWVRFLGTAPLMMVTSQVVYGVDDVAVLMCSFVLLASTIVIGGFAEFHRSWKICICAWIPFLLAMFDFIVIVFFRIFGEVKLSNMSGIYLQCYVQMILYVMFGVVQVLDLWQVSIFKSYRHVEFTYTFLSMICKTALGCIVFYELF